MRIATAPLMHRIARAFHSSERKGYDLDCNSILTSIDIFDFYFGNQFSLRESADVAPVRSVTMRAADRMALLQIRFSRSSRARVVGVRKQASCRASAGALDRHPALRGRGSVGSKADWFARRPKPTQRNVWLRTWTRLLDQRRPRHSSEQAVVTKASHTSR